MQDDPLLFDYNVEERVNDFVAAALAQVHSDLDMVMFLLLFPFGFQCTLFAPMYTQGLVNATTDFTVFSLYWLSVVVVIGFMTRENATWVFFLLRSLTFICILYYH